MRIRNLMIQTLTVVVVVVAWFLVTRHGLVTRLLLPNPGEVYVAVDKGLIGATWWPHVWITLEETALGFIIGVFSGMFVGAVFAFVNTLRIAFYPFVIALMSFPKIAIAPLLIVAFGYGLTPKVIISALIAFFPIMTSARAGLSEVDPAELNLMKTIQASPWQELRYLRLPNAMSYIFPALDVALIGALLGAVAAELIGAQGGFGYLLAQSQAYGDVAGIYGVLLTLAIMGTLLHGLIVLVQKMLPPSIMPVSR